MSLVANLLSLTVQFHFMVSMLLPCSIVAAIPILYLVFCSVHKKKRSVSVSKTRKQLCRKSLTAGLNLF